MATVSSTPALSATGHRTFVPTQDANTPDSLRTVGVPGDDLIGDQTSRPLIADAERLSDQETHPASESLVVIPAVNLRVMKRNPTPVLIGPLRIRWWLGCLVMPFRWTTGLLFRWEGDFAALASRANMPGGLQPSALTAEASRHDH